MVTSTDTNLVPNVKLSSVGPGRVTGSDVVHEPTGLDLAVKLHYLTGVYVFRSHAIQGLTIPRIKEAMFEWLNHYYYSCGRFRRSESGRPYVKCNDCGARFVEGHCDKTVDEWLEMKDFSLQNLPVYHLPIGPELAFSPPLYTQVTWFKCGGMSLALSFAHVLGDAFSLSDCINKWSRCLATLQANGSFTTLKKSPSPTKTQQPKYPAEITKPKQPLSIKRVDPVGDHWVTPNSCKMDTISFHLTATQISHLHSKTSTNKIIPLFESLCAIIWQCIAKIRDGDGPNIVTICKKDPHRESGKLSNSQIISAVEAKFSIIDADLEKLASVLVNEAADERGQIEEVMEKEHGVVDVIVYGANLTFVDLEDADLYGMELNGNKADFISYTIQGVGDEGTVLVLPGPSSGNNNGRFVTMILPEDQALKLKPELIHQGLLPE